MRIQAKEELIKKFEWHDNFYPIRVNNFSKIWEKRQSVQNLK